MSEERQSEEPGQSRNHPPENSSVEVHHFGQAELRRFDLELVTVIQSTCTSQVSGLMLETPGRIVRLQIHGFMSLVSTIHAQKGGDVRQGGHALRACFKIAWGPAARDFGCGQGGEAGAAPQRAVTAEPTPAAAKRPAARRVFAQKAAWLRCSSVEDPPGIFSFVAPRQAAFCAKTGPHGILKQALKPRRGERLASEHRFIVLPSIMTHGEM